MKHLIQGLILTLSSTLLLADGCWSSIELSEYGQKSLDDVTVFSFKDAVDCQPLSGVKMNFLGKEFISDKEGTLSLPVPPDEIDAYVPVKLSKEKYISIKQNIPVSVGTYWQTYFLMTKELPLDSARFILSWGKEPADLDLHLTSEDFHISYRKTRSIPNRVKLDRDARQGYGPETITLNKLKAEKTYKVLIHRYSTVGEINKEVKLSTYLNNTFKKTIFLPQSEAKCVQVAQIKDKKIVYETKEVNESECK